MCSFCGRDYHHARTIEDIANHLAVCEDITTLKYVCTTCGQVFFLHKKTTNNHSTISLTYN